jgi:hypothetical protein
MATALLSQAKTRYTAGQVVTRRFKSRLFRLFANYLIDSSVAGAYVAATTDRTKLPAAKRG